MQPKKKLLPKSAFLVKKYERQIRIAFIAFITVLCFLFVTRSSDSSSDVMVIKEQNGSRLMPHADRVQKIKYPPNDGKKVKATMVTLARNEDLWSLVNSIRHVEDRFNKNYHYDWVFLNDVPFSEEFKRVTSALASGECKYGLIPQEQWSFPDWIDQDKAAKTRKEMREAGILYGDSISYRHMCRYESGFFWRHPLLDDYEYYWRVEPDIKIHCDIEYDVFRMMKENNKKYGFIISLSEYEATIPTLWSTTKEFIEKNPEYLAKDNLQAFVSDDAGDTYNMCHFWSNFEIASLDLWRSPAYREYFDYLDRAGGFFYERWGDAPVHSIAASLFLNKDELHFFDGIGYYHPDFSACPVEEPIRIQNKCVCDPARDITWYPSYFCTMKYFSARKLSLPAEVKLRA